MAEEESFTMIGLLKDLPEERLSWLISSHVEFFGLTEENIRKELPVATKSKNVDDHIDFLMEVMIGLIPDEPTEPLLKKWYFGQVLRFAKDLIDANKPEQTNKIISETTGFVRANIAQMEDFMRFTRECDKARTDGVLFKAPTLKH